jgi:ribosome biogenesis SPOUT family RNA methylase Rps3
MSDQLPLFELKRPNGSRCTITGSANENEMTDTQVPAMRMDQIVMVLARATITKVTHARMKDGTLERQHVVVIDPASIELGTPDDYTALGGLLWDRLQLRGGARFGTVVDTEEASSEPVPAALGEQLAICAPAVDAEIVDAEIIEDDTDVDGAETEEADAL